jgi:hypothetical protein
MTMPGDSFAQHGDIPDVTWDIYVPFFTTHCPDLTPCKGF